MSEHQEIWCQPSDQPKRQFVVIFDDPQMDLAVFDNEEEARAFWEKANLNWTCYLLGTLPRDQSSECQRQAEVMEEVRKVADLVVNNPAFFTTTYEERPYATITFDNAEAAHRFNDGLIGLRALISKLEGR